MKNSFKPSLGMAGLLALNFAAGAVAAQEQLPATLGVPYIPLVEFKADDRHHVLGTTDDRVTYLVMKVGANLLFTEGGLRVIPERPPAGILPDGVVETGDGAIAAAWLFDPTTRYAHGILGDAIEAGGLAVEFPDGQIAEVRLDPDLVFEDRRARIVDVDGDGEDEILVVRTNVNFGAALAVYAISDGVLRLRAAADPIGLSHRWLNPIGVADFDGDGRLEIAAVVTPHLAGDLTIYRESDGALVPVAAVPGYSNHVIGSRKQGMAAIWDVNGDGADDIIVPSVGYRRVAIVTFAGGTARELGWIDHDAFVATNIVVGLVSGVRAAVYGLSDGTVVVLPLEAIGDK
ncbi:MAG: VCBS repeat-containing protein [Alphaproteobacteria bacterium]|nr:VCBS repeat-containing protein [Alphaproteobacteria bacterium]